MYPLRDIHLPDLSDAIDDAIEAAVTEGVASYTVDGETTTAIDPAKLIELAKFAAARTATADGRSMWGRTRMARAIPQGFGT